MASAGYLTALHARWLAEAPDRRFRELDATLLFADVSDFTRLGERLARKGKVGSEELTETVNSVFAGLLVEVGARGGEVLKFGGDAVLALFADDSHALRGAAAGLAMQAALRTLRRESGVNLRLSAGVASGTTHLFLAGDTPRELIVAGPLASAVCALEAAAQPGQVLASAATAAAVPSTLRGERRGPGLLLLGAAPATPAVKPPTVPPGFDPGPGLPRHLHAHEPGEGEHRIATVAFLQFRGTDDLLRAAGPAALARALDAVVGSVGEAALAYGVTFVGTDVDRNAGKVILAAGAPVSSPDDDDRMLHALHAILSGDHRLELRAGANRGHVFTVDVGSPERRSWTLMGDAVNLAARVMAHAEPETVLATPSVLARLHDDFEREPTGPLTLKGKSTPLVAERVGPARGARLTRRSASERPVGRDAELAVVRDALAAARAGRDRVLELVGEPGIGKTRLVEAAVAEANDMTVVAVAGGPYAVHSPYRAVSGPLRGLLGARPHEDDTRIAALLSESVHAVAPQLEPWVPLIAIAFGLALPPTPAVQALSPRFARARLNAETSRLVAALLPASGALIVVEDAHWLDEASSDLIAHLVRRIRGRGVCVLLTRRDAPSGLTLDSYERAVTLRLAPLDDAAARELLGEQAAALPPGAEAVLVERAGGNPLLLQELVAAARDGQPLDALPGSVEALVTARIDPLAPADRSLLRQMAVLGVRVPMSLLVRLVGSDGGDLRAALDRLATFVVADGAGVVRFRHALLRDAAYEALPFSRRRELHSRAADLIAEHAGDRVDEQAEMLAIHLHAAQRWPETWRVAEIAGQLALDRAAPVEAADFFARALAAGRAMRGDPLALARLGERQGDALRLAGRFEEAAAAFVEARRRARGDPLAEAALCLKIARLRERSRHLAQSVRWVTRGLKVLELEPPRPEVEAVRGQLLITRGLVCVHRGRLREATRHAEQAVRMAKTAGERHLLAAAYNQLHWAHTLLGSPERDRYRGLALPIFEELGDLEWQGKTLNNLGVDAYWSGRWDEAVSFYERGREVLERAGDVVEAAVLLSNIAEIRSDQGRLDEAEPRLHEALAVHRAAGFRLGIGFVTSTLGRAALRRGDPEAAGHLYQRARQTLSQVGATAMVLELDTHEAERLVFAGKHEAALELAGRLRQTASECQAPPALMALNQRVAALAKLHAGDVDGARARLRESVEIARSVGATYEEALSLHALGRLGDDAAAAQAHDLLEGLGIVSVSLPLTSPAISSIGPDPA